MCAARFGRTANQKREIRQNGKTYNVMLFQLVRFVPNANIAASQNPQCILFIHKRAPSETHNLKSESTNTHFEMSAFLMSSKT